MIPIVQVVVRDNNVDQALKALKKKMQREGVFREMKLRRSYEKPSEKRARESAEAVEERRHGAAHAAGRAGIDNVPKRTLNFGEDRTMFKGIAAAQIHTLLFAAPTP